MATVAEAPGKEAASIPVSTPISTIEKPNEVPENWQPNIIAFACHYCAFAAADLAGVMRLTYPTGIKVIRMPCTGKLDHIYVLRAFEKGVDGVFVAG